MAERALPHTSVQEKRLQSLGNLVASLKKGVTYAILVSGALLAVSPLIWMISTSLMSLGEAQGVRLVPSTIQFRKLHCCLAGSRFGRLFHNAEAIYRINSQERLKRLS